MQDNCVGRESNEPCVSLSFPIPINVTPSAAPAIKRHKKPKNQKQLIVVKIHLVSLEKDSHLGEPRFLSLAFPRGVKRLLDCDVFAAIKPFPRHHLVWLSWLLNGRRRMPLFGFNLRESVMSLAFARERQKQREKKCQYSANWKHNNGIYDL